MKNLKTSPGIIALAAAAIFSSQSLRAATPIWNNAAGGNWSIPGNWSTAAIPVDADDVQFGNTGAGSLITMDAGFNIDSLTFNQDNGSTQTLVLNSGLTLNVNRTTTGDPLTVQGLTTPSGTTQVPVSIQGAGATINVTSSTGNIVVRQGFPSANGSHMATLDLSGLDTFNANVARLLIGVAGNGDAHNRPSGTLLLAKTNVLTLTGASPTAPAVMVQDGTQNANGSTVSVLSLGQVNTINADYFRLGGQKGNGNVNFNPVFSNPSLILRGNSLNRAPQIVVGDHSLSSSGNTVVAVTDLSLGSVDILVDTNIVAKGNLGAGSCTGTLSLGAGTMDVNTLIVGLQTATGTASGAVTSTMNVGNNGIVTTNLNDGMVSTGAVVRVNTSLIVAQTSGGTGAVLGTLNISGGTVYANNIIAGRGNSTIAMNSLNGQPASLVVSNNAGTLVNPIRNFTINDSSLTLPALNAGAALAVSNFTAGGGGNIINISSVPPIGSYPATFTLISSVFGSSGNFTLGTLPSSSYHGSIVDLGNGNVQLTLSSGPLVDLSVQWTGTQSSDWDIGTTLNWLTNGTPAVFFPGATPIFNDDALNTGVNLAASISSGTVTVDNDVVQYDFFGPGNIAGASALVKQGTQPLIIENEGVNNFGSVTIANGTLQIGNGDTNGDISTLNITDNSSLVVNRSGSITLAAAIAGTGSLTKDGDGTLTLTGVSSYNGATTLDAGGLEVDGSLGSSAVTTAAGTLLTGSGSIGGPVTVGGALNPGSVNTAGTLTASNGLSLASGSTLTFDLNGADPNNPAINDAINVQGNLNLTNNSVNANFQGVPFVGNSYPLFTYTGTLSGGFNPTVTGSHFTMALDTNAVQGAVYLSVTGGSGSTLSWSSVSDTTWDSTTTNWTDLSTHGPSLFFSGDSIMLDDTSSQPTLAIPANVSVYPNVISNTSDNVAFTINGPGKISGTGNIVKTGQSTLTINSGNDFTGTVDIQNGVLVAGNGTALGSTTAGTTVEPGATLDINSQVLGGEVITIAGNGFNGLGALINNGNIQGTALRSLVLSSNASVGGTGQFSINNSGGTASVSTQGQPYKLTKVGANLVGLQNLTVDAALGDIEVQQGILEFNGSTPGMGDPNYTNYVDAGATLQFASDSVVWNKFFDLTGDGSANTVNNGTAALTELAGQVTLHNSVVINVGGSSMTISGPIVGDGSLTKKGSSPLILSNVETYTGDTTISVGAMRLAGNATIANSTNIFIAAGATLTVTGRVDATFTMVSSQNLSGNGVVAGSLVSVDGSTVSPGLLNGLGSVGVLTVSNSITLGGTNIMELDQDNKTNDMLRCNGAITYGGVLNLPTLSSGLTNGASFQLFKAGSYSGSFASITPATPGNGLAWNTSALSSGIIAVTNGAVVGPTTNATIYSVKAVGTNFVLHGTNNNSSPTSFRYVVFSSTNVALPLSSWTPVVTNSFINTDGSFDYTNPIDPATPRQFFDLKVIP